MAARIRSDWQYRTSFFTYLVAQASIVAFEFVALVLLFELVPDLGGWNLYQVLFLYGLAALPFMVSNLTIASVEHLSDYVQAGTFDRLLLRPVPAMVQLVALDFELRRVGKLLAPTAVLIWALPRAGIEWRPSTIAVLAVTLLCGTGIYAALWIAAASLSFWMVASREATNSVTYGGEFANEYPLHLYRGWIRAVLGWAIPLAFVAYVPSVYLFTSADQTGSANAESINPLGLPSWLFFITPVVTVVALAIALGLWSLGIRHYQSTGS